MATYTTQYGSHSPRLLHCCCHFDFFVEGGHHDVSTFTFEPVIYTVEFYIVNNFYLGTLFWRWRGSAVGETGTGPYILPQNTTIHCRPDPSDVIISGETTGWRSRWKYGFFRRFCSCVPMLLSPVDKYNRISTVPQTTTDAAEQPVKAEH